jgi:predicted dithiol-disulfide oxidoreductase (DUF899 family)
LTEIEPFKSRMGWKFRWISSFNTDFNFDFHVSFTPEQVNWRAVAVTSSAALTREAGERLGNGAPCN